MDTPTMPETDEESAAPEGTSEDLSNGYCVHLYVTSEGFKVSAAEPISQEQEEGEYTDDLETYPDLMTAIKHIVAEVKSNPLGDDANAQFAAGYSEGPGGQGSQSGSESSNEY